MIAIATVIAFVAGAMTSVGVLLRVGMATEDPASPWSRSQQPARPWQPGALSVCTS